MQAANKRFGLVTVEENALAGGLGSAVLELLENDINNIKIKRLEFPTVSFRTAAGNGC